MTKYEVTYYKGLAALENTEYKEMLLNPRKFYYELDENAHKELDIWFGKDSDKRKEKLK